MAQYRMKTKGATRLKSTGRVKRWAEGEVISVDPGDIAHVSKDSYEKVSAKEAESETAPAGIEHEPLTSERTPVTEELMNPLPEPAAPAETSEEVEEEIKKDRGPESIKDTKARK